MVIVVVIQLVITDYCCIFGQVFVKTGRFVVIFFTCLLTGCAVYHIAAETRSQIKGKDIVRSVDWNCLAILTLVSLYHYTVAVVRALISSRIPSFVHCFGPMLRTEKTDFGMVKKVKIRNFLCVSLSIVV